jgi:hypothetical protein
MQFGVILLVYCFTAFFVAITHNKRREAVVVAAYSHFELYRLMRLSRGDIMPKYLAVEACGTLRLDPTHLLP